MKINVANERSRVKRDNFMLILLISSAELTVQQWAMERESDERRSEVPAREREREIKKDRQRKRKREG